MKKFSSFGLSIYLIVIIASIILANYFVNSYPVRIEPVSPLPDFLTSFKNNQVATLSVWIPQIKGIFNLNEPKISAKAAIVYDLTKNKTIYSKNPQQKLPIASLTKIMTAVIALENKKSDDFYVVKKSDLVGENAMGLSEGETLNLRELLYGLILVSGNDSAEVLASNFPGGRKSFIQAMNNKAKALGLKNTNFTNPSGLEGDGDQYSTAYDLLVVTKYALSKFPTFNDIVSTPVYEIYYTGKHKYFYLENETNLLTSYQGVRGVKTGYTPEAGLCLVTYLKYEGHEIIGVILSSDNRRDEMKELLDYSLKEQGIRPPKHT